MTDDKRFTQDAISKLEPIEPSARLRRMVAQIPIEHPHKERVFWPFGSLWVPSFSLAAVAALGLYVGQLQTTPGAGTSKSAAVATVTRTDEEVAPSTLDENGPTTTGDDDLDTLLVLATAADFEPSDWDLSQQSTREESEQAYQ